MQIAMGATGRVVVGTLAEWQAALPNLPPTLAGQLFNQISQVEVRIALGDTASGQVVDAANVAASARADATRQDEARIEAAMRRVLASEQPKRPRPVPDELEMSGPLR